MISTILSSGSLTHTSASVILLLIPSSVLLRRQWHPTPVLLPGKSHGRRSLVGCSPWGHKESDTTERLHFHFQCIFYFSLLFSSSRSLVNISCIFSILFLKSWVTFIFIILNSFSGSLLISISFSCFSGVFLGFLHLGDNLLLFHFD